MASSAGPRVRGALWPIAQTALAAGVAWYVAHDVLGHRQPFFAPIAAAVALSTTYTQRSRRSVQMVIGVLLGIGVSELLRPLVGDGAGSIAVVVLVTLVLAVGLGVGFVGEGMMFFNQAAASAVLVIALHKAGTGAERAIDALVGGAVALAIGVGLFPGDPLKLLWRAEQSVLRSLRDVLERRPMPTFGAPAMELAMDAVSPEAAWVLDASNEVHTRLTELTQARGTAHTTVRVAPRRMRERAALDAEEGRVASVYLLASAVLSLMRTAVDVEGVQTPVAERTTAMGELAVALAALADSPRPWPERTTSELAANMRRLADREQPSASPQHAILAIAVRRVAVDILRLLSADDVPG